jgi:hypothetical protein
MASRYGAKSKQKVARAMRERKRGALKSGSGQKVKSRKQAIAIGLSEARRAGGKVPARKKKASSGRKTSSGTGRKSSSGARSGGSRRRKSSSSTSRRRGGSTGRRKTGSTSSRRKTGGG